MFRKYETEEKTSNFILWLIFSPFMLLTASIINKRAKFVGILQ